MKPARKPRKDIVELSLILFHAHTVCSTWIAPQIGVACMQIMCLSSGFLHTHTQTHKYAMLGFMFSYRQT